MAIYPEGADMIRPSEYEMADYEIENMLINDMLKEEIDLYEEDLINKADAEIELRRSRQNLDYGKGESGTIEMDDGSSINYTMDNPDALFQDPPAPGYHEIERDGQLFGVEIMDDGTIGSVSPLGGQIVGGDAPIDEQLSPSEGLNIDNYSAYSEKFDEYYNPETGMTWDGSRIDTEISPAGQDLSRMFSAQDLQTGQVVSDLLLGTLAAPMIPGMGLRPLRPMEKLLRRNPGELTRIMPGELARRGTMPGELARINPGKLRNFSKYDPKLGPFSKAINAPINQGGTTLPLRPGAKKAFDPNVFSSKINQRTKNMLKKYGELDLFNTKTGKISSPFRSGEYMTTVDSKKHERLRRILNQLYDETGKLK